MASRSTSVKETSLRKRLLWGFVLCVGLIWTAIVCWGLYTVLTGGTKEIEREASAYGRQVLAVASVFKDNPKVWRLRSDKSS